MKFAVVRATPSRSPYKAVQTLVQQIIHLSFVSSHDEEYSRNRGEIWSIVEDMNTAKFTFVTQQQCISGFECSSGFVSFHVCLMTSFPLFPLYCFLVHTTLRRIVSYPLAHILFCFSACSA